MSEPLSSVVRVAATPGQAKVFVALLQAQGIPAYVEGDSLADEFAASRRLLNLLGTEVKVPTASLEQARQILAGVKIDPAELEQEALAATGGETPIPPPPPVEPRKHSRWPLVVAIVAAILFFALWLASLEASALARNPQLDYFDYEITDWGYLETRRSDQRLMRSLEDRDRDGFYEGIRLHGRDGKVVVRFADEDEDGIYESAVEIHEGFTARWLDRDVDGRFDECRVTDAQGDLTQTITWQPGVGYVVKKG